MAEQIPERDLDTGEGVVGLEEVKAVAADKPRDPRDVCDVVKRLPKDGIEHRLASAVRAWANRRSDGGKGRRLAFAPADMTAAGDTHQKRVLAAVALQGDLGHRQIEEVDRVDPHRAHPPALANSREHDAASRP